MKLNSRSGNYWLKRSNLYVPEIGLVTMFWPLMMTGSGVLFRLEADQISVYSVKDRKEAYE